MTVLLVENFKLILLAVLIGSIVGFSRSSGVKAPSPNRLPQPYRTASARP
jgi:hypothetical protein